MPSEVITALITNVLIAAERENAVVLAKSMTIDNQGGTSNRIVSIQDVFTPDTSVGGTVTPQDIARFQTTVLAGDIITLGEEDLKGVKCLGAMYVLSDVADAAGDRCYVTVGYEHE